MTRVTGGSSAIIEILDPLDQPQVVPGELAVEQLPAGWRRSARRSRRNCCSSAAASWASDSVWVRCSLRRSVSKAYWSSRVMSCSSRAEPVSPRRSVRWSAGRGVGRPLPVVALDQAEVRLLAFERQLGLGEPGQRGGLPQEVGVHLVRARRSSTRTARCW